MSFHDPKKKGRSGRDDDEDEYEDDYDDEDEESDDDGAPNDDDEDDEDESEEEQQSKHHKRTDGCDDDDEPHRRRGTSHAKRGAHEKPHEDSSWTRRGTHHSGGRMYGTCRPHGSAGPRDADDYRIGQKQLEQSQHFFRDIARLNDAMEEAVVFDPEIKFEYTATITKSNPYFGFHLSRAAIEGMLHREITKHGLGSTYHPRKLLDSCFIVSHCGTMTGRPGFDPATLLISSLDSMNAVEFFPYHWRDHTDTQKHVGVIAGFSGATDKVSFSSLGKYRDHQHACSKAHSICHLISGLEWYQTDEGEMVLFKKDSIYGRTVEFIAKNNPSLAAAMTASSQTVLHGKLKNACGFNPTQFSTKSYYFATESVFSALLLPRLMAEIGSKTHSLKHGMTLHLIAANALPVNRLSELHKENSEITEAFTTSPSYEGNTIHVRIGLKLVAFLPQQ